MYAHSRSYETRTHGDEANAIILLGFPKARCSMLPPAPLGHFPSEAGGRMSLVAHGLCDGWLATCTMVHARRIHASCSRVCLIGYRLTGCMVRGSPTVMYTQDLTVVHMHDCYAHASEPHAASSSGACGSVSRSALRRVRSHCAFWLCAASCVRMPPLKLRLGEVVGSR